MKDYKARRMERSSAGKERERPESESERPESKRDKISPDD
jgi:hypothetical protein